jgi:uncharacterized caspase-like protein
MLLVILTTGLPAYADGGEKRALLIGINKYQELPWLTGSRNDVEVVHNLLVRRYGFPEENIRTLLDEAATRAAILDALQELVADAGPDDTVFVHYSGHGSQVEDLDNEESDALDETICPHDARTADIPDITDDELGRILGRLKVLSAVVILDSCHSGTALRAAPADIRSRSVPADTRIELYSDDRIVTRGVVPAPGSEPYVLFSAAAAHQQELDGPFGIDGERLGLMTAALSRTLQSRTDDASPRELLDGIAQNVEKIKPMFAGYPVPQAQLEGPLELIDKPLFSPIPGRVANTPVPTRVQDRPPQGARKFFTSDHDQRRLLQRAIPKDVAAGIEWTDTIDDADVVIECTPGTECEIYGPDGIVRVASLPNDDAVTERVAEIALRAGAIAELLSIDESGGELDLRLGATGRAAMNTAPMGTRGIQLTASVANHRIRFYDPQDKRTHLNSLQLSVQTDMPCYLTLVSVDSAGTVQQLLPNPLSEQARFVPDGHLQARQTYLVPDSFADDNRAGFHLDYVPPAGTDTVRAFCTVERGLAVALREDIAAIAAGRPGVSIGRTLVAARGLTELRPQGTATAGGVWGTATITIEISGR